MYGKCFSEKKKKKKKKKKNFLQYIFHGNSGDRNLPITVKNRAYKVKLMKTLKRRDIHIISDYMVRQPIMCYNRTTLLVVCLFICMFVCLLFNFYWKCIFYQNIF